MLVSQTVSPCPHEPVINWDSGLFQQVALRLRKTRTRTSPIPCWRCAGRAMTGKLPGTWRPPSSLFFAWPKAMRKDGRRGSDTMMVATQSRFHRDMPDGEQIALKPLSFFLLPNLQVVTLSPLRLMKKGRITLFRWVGMGCASNGLT